MNLVFELEAVGTTDIRFAVLDEDDVLWPHPRSGGDYSVLFDAEDVLSYLADSWGSLLLSEVWPDIFEPWQEPRSITGLLRAAEDRWEQLPTSDEAEVALEQADVEAFLYKHDLRSMKNGGALSEFYVLRQGDRYIFETGGQVFNSCSFVSFIQELERLGTFARDILVEAGSEYERTVARWDVRNDADPILITSYITGLRKTELDKEPNLLEPLLSSLEGRSLKDIANDNAAPLVAVARSSGGLGPRGIADMIRVFRTLPPGSTVSLAQRRRIVQADIKQVSNPTDQGVRAATSVRDWLNFPINAAFDLTKACHLLGVVVQEVEDLDGRIDGLASVGPEHGPAILLNRNTIRRGATADDLDRALRFTWAHELGHLLLDDGEWPAIIDSAQQRVSRRIETRANAFAAYLLLPAALAYKELDDRRPRIFWVELEPVLNEIGTRFQVPRIVVSRQVVRGAPPERRRQLESVFQQNIPNF
jgi:Zn-dependent peptidase ImmA (M78 family)